MGKQSVVITNKPFQETIDYLEPHCRVVANTEVEVWGEAETMAHLRDAVAMMAFMPDNVDEQVASGQRFNFEFFDRDDFVYNTEPACRAVVTARRLAPLKAIPMMKSVQQAFYTENRDVTQTDELVGIAVATGFDEGEFETVFEDMDTMDETRGDFWLAQNSRVTDFPTLIAVQDGKAQAVTIGYSPWKQIGPALKQWMGRKPH